jgi:hypothetical protein
MALKRGSAKQAYERAYDQKMSAAMTVPGEKSEKRAFKVVSDFGPAGDQGAPR